MITQIIDMLIPERCVGCGKAMSVCCKNCKEKMFYDIAQTCYRCNRLSPGGRTCRICRGNSSVFAVQKLLPYSNNAKRMVRAMKFDLRRSLCAVFAHEMTERLAMPRVDIVTYIPTAPRRVRERGFDHAQLMACEVVRLHASAPLRRTLARTSSLRQVGSNRAVRLQQMQHVFEVTTPTIVQGKNVLLIDDVITTGATIEAAASVLLAAGARRVYVFAVAVHHGNRP